MARSEATCREPLLAWRQAVQLRRAARRTVVVSLPAANYDPAMAREPRRRACRKPRLGARTVLALALLAGGWAACTPSAQDCRDLMPVDAKPAVPAPTPAGTRGCRIEQDGTVIQVEAVRRNMHWERGRIWIDGVETPESDLSSALLAAKARHAATDIGKALRTLRDSAKAFRDNLRNPPPPPTPNPDQSHP
jgi:hypothetical protein